MNTNANDGDIVKLEKRYWQAMKENDVEAAVSLTSFPCLVSGPQGHHEFNEQDYRSIMAKANQGQYSDVEIAGEKVEFLSPDVAIITYSAKVKGMDMLDVSTWVNENGSWRCKFHSENPKH